MTGKFIMQVSHHTEVAFASVMSLPNVAADFS